MAEAQPAIGREAELDLLDEFLGSAAHRTGCLVLEGPAGIGKTILWQAGLAASSRRGARTLVASARDGETTLGFAGLADLLDGVDLDAIHSLPQPQREALETALLIRPREQEADERTVFTALLTTLRALAAEGQVLVAVDDLPFLDRPSGSALAFSARRLREEPVGFLIARREDEGPSEFERALGEDRLRRVALAPLSLGATRRLLHERLGVTLSRRTLLRIFEAAGGNPLFALELTRSLLRRGGDLGPGDDFELPDSIGTLLEQRLDAVPPPVEEALLAVALGPDARRGELEALGLGEALEDAAGAGVLAIEGEKLMLCHPLLGAAARDRSRPRERRELHRRLAEVTTDEERRARHLALSLERPDASAASEIASAARRAAARGARASAAELAEHALRATPADAAERDVRVLDTAEQLIAAGELPRARELLIAATESAPSGPLRARTALLWVAAEAGDSLAAQVDIALEHAAGDPALLASALAQKSCSLTCARVTSVAEAESLALEAFRIHPAGARVFTALGWARILSGRGVDDLVALEAGISGPPVRRYDSVERLHAIRLRWRGELDAARERFSSLVAQAEERGEAESHFALRLQQCELEMTAGTFEAAERAVEELEQESGVTVGQPAAVARCRALIAAGRGFPAAAHRHADEAIATAPAERNWQTFEAMRAHGLAAILEGDHLRAAEYLGRVWRHMRAEGVEDPGAFPVAPELVEALAALGRVDEANEVAETLGRLALEQDHGWGLAGAARARALVRIARREDADALELLGEAAARYEDLGLRFAHARTLLFAGDAMRRLRRRRDGRELVERAVRMFDELGCAGWSEHAQAELGRFGGRRSFGDELTPAEERVARLVAAGRRNREVASELYLTVATVEGHLSHVYSKLGIRSRAELARLLAPSASDGA